MKLKIQKEAFDAAAEVADLVQGRSDIGAVVTFQGLVRDQRSGQGDDPVETMELQHYPEMTERMIRKVAQTASERFEIEDCLIIHRFGLLKPGDPIVLVATFARHRKAAFQAAEYLIDYLKTEAPFWKKEAGPDGSAWVDAREADDEATRKWKA